MQSVKFTDRSNIFSPPPKAGKNKNATVLVETLSFTTAEGGEKTKMPLFEKIFTVMTLKNV
ncbi:MAG: hypothetical protein LBR79_04465 [Oscillospiraceae bacterium]|nr:hypothetical protein [Oscillospiraceae bacterium]